MKLSRRTGCRLFIILCISIVVVLIQILTVSRLSTSNKYPWEDEELRNGYSRSLEEHRRLRNPNEDKPLADTGTNTPRIVTISPKSFPNNTINFQDRLPVNDNNNNNNNDQSQNSFNHLDKIVDDSQSSMAEQEQTPLEPIPPRVLDCEPHGKDALSALERAKTKECKQKIHETICLSQANKLYNVSLKNQCPLGRNPAKQFHSVPYSEGKGSDIRIVFLMSIHGRAVREVKRLFKAVYHSNHYYYIHVDYNSDYLYKQLKIEFKDFPNVYFPEWRMATIWGGASLLQMLLKALEELEYILTDWRWDYFINLSESDYPLRTNGDLVQFLKVQRKYNFVKTHGGDIKKFVQKQGLDRTFVECDYHMWRIGNRQLPQDITIDGGSDWIVINRNYSHYLVTNQDPFLMGLKKYYEYSLLPAESFFHTVLRNGPMCDTLVRSNLRITNWNRKLGCRCQYKHIVDWCGCSPNNFLDKDFGKLTSPKEDQFFARKFEPIVNQNVINNLDGHLYGHYPDDTPGLNAYWESLYHYDYDENPSSDAHYTVYNSFMRLTTKNLMIKQDAGNQLPGRNDDCDIPEEMNIIEAFVYYNNDQFVGYVLRFEGDSNNADDSTGSGVFESLLVPIEHQVVGEMDNCFQMRSATIEVGSKWDGKESIFRNYGGILGIYDQPTVAIRLKIGRVCNVNVLWINSLGIEEQKTDLKLDPSMTVNTQKLNTESPIMPGNWAVRITSSDALVVEKHFIVFPLMFDHGEPLLQPMLVNAKRIVILRPGMDEEKYMEWRINILKEGIDLEEWIDKLVTDSWTLQSSCSYDSTNNCRTLPICQKSLWSSYYPDIKSELGPVNSQGRIR